MEISSKLLLLLCSHISFSFAIEPLTARSILKSQSKNENLNINIDSQSENESEWAEIQELYIEQPLDHFEFTTSSSSNLHISTLQQRYFYSSRYSSPVSTKSDTTLFSFLCVGGEGPSLTKHVLSDSVHCSGDMLELAKQIYEDGYSVHLFALEHRYYGESYPDFINPVSNQNLTFLSSRQALADISHFIPTMNQKIIVPSSSSPMDVDIKWVTFGGSYPGMLAAWARYKFPHLVHASVSNSSPVQAQLDFPEYYNHVSVALSDEMIGGSEECLEIIEKGHAQVKEILDTMDTPTVNEDGVTNVANLFNVCNGVEGLKEPMDRHVFLGDGVIALDVQGNDPSCTGKLCNIKKICKSLLQKDENLSFMERLAELSQEQQSQCANTSWEDMVRFISSPFAKRGGLRSWLWQTCTEFGFYQTCEIESKCPYGKGYHVLDQDLELCEKAFGVDKERVNLSVKASIDYYGGWKINGSQIIFTNGDVDPWSMLALTGDRGSLVQPTVMVEGASHHFWTHQVEESDSKEVNFARQIIYYQVKEWLGVEEKIELKAATF